MESVFSQIGPWIFFLTLGSGMGIPLGIPPAPDDPVMVRFAPEECVFYTTWSASAVANPLSKNQAEQMLAEPEVRQFVEHLEKWIRHSVAQPASDRDASNLSDATFDTILMILRHQTTLFVSDVKIKDKKVSAKGGMVVALGADTPLATKLFHQNVRAFFLNLNVEALEVLRIDGQNWYRVKPKAEFPTMIVGIKDSYLIVAVGDGSLDRILQWMQKPAPQWLVQARRIATLERPTGLTYINLQRLREVGPASTDLHRKQWGELLGLAQSPWLVSASGLVGPDVVTRTVLPIEGEPRGLLLPANGRGLTREDMAAIPEDATLALAVRLNVQKTLDALVAAGKKADPEVKEALLKGLETLQHGGDADSQHVFASLGDRWCFYNSPREGGLVMTGLTGIVPITDRKKFSRSYEVLTRLATEILPMADDFGSNGQKIHRFRFAGSDVHYATLGGIGLTPAWWAGDKQFVVALAPQNIKAYLSRGKDSRSLADVPEVAAEFSGRDPLLAIGYLDAPRLFEAIYPLLIISAPSFLGVNGLSEGRRDMSMIIPSLPSVCRHLRPGVATLRRTGVGLELTSRGSLPGFGLAAPVMFLVWDSEWLNLVFGESENNAPPIPVVPGVVPAGPVAPPAMLPPALPLPAGGR
ncbi:MAG: hypothetical protein WCJ35_10480 [Planctomycetota bacterium]